MLQDHFREVSTTTQAICEYSLLVGSEGGFLEGLRIQD